MLALTMATGERPVASSESNTEAAEQAGLDQKRGNLTRRATLWNQFDALMRAQSSTSSDQKSPDKDNDGKESENTGNSKKEPVATKNSDGNAAKTIRKIGQDVIKAGKRERHNSEGSDEKQSKCVKMDKLSRSKSVSLKATASESKHKGRKTVETTGIGELDDTQEPKGTIGKIKAVALRSGQDGSDEKSTSRKSADTAAAAEAKNIDGGQLRQKMSVERTSKGTKDATMEKGICKSSSDGAGKISVDSGSVEKNGHSGTRSTGEDMTVRESGIDRSRTGGSPHSGCLRVSDNLNQSRPHSQESGASQRTDNLEEPLTFSRPGSSGSEYNHRSDVNLSESLNRWVTHLTTEQTDSPRTSPRMTASVSPLPGDYPSYGKPVMPGYKPMSTKQESLVLPRPARVVEPLHPNPSLRDCIPIMPKSAAIVCFLLNILVPGLGTFFSAFSLMCCGRTRPIGTDILSCFMNNCWAGLLQLLSTPVLLVGWIWSIIWGLVFLELSAKPPDGEGSPLAQSSTTGSRASNLSRIGQSSRTSIRSRAVPGRSATVAPMASSASQDRPPIITLQEAPVIISHNTNAEPHTSQQPQPAANQSNYRYHRMMQRHQRAAAASNNELPFLRTAHMDDFVRLSASVFGIAMVQSEGDNAAAAESDPNQKL
ncbi:uncharacterized protein LOC135485086 [Lineus longissimus]|uniref:uncharacterized protein LOC135485086 n=1 Tax=Lineus longissimus TaxID=88925 RepID=UPI002B4F0CED